MRACEHVCVHAYTACICVPYTHISVACVLTHAYTSSCHKAPLGSALLTSEWGLYIGRGPFVAFLALPPQVPLALADSVPCLLTGWVVWKPLADSGAGRDSDISTNPVKGQGEKERVL